MSIDEERNAVLQEIITWANTPYHHGACVKGAGTSCSWFLAGVYNNAIGTNFEVDEHFEQWWASSKNPDGTPIEMYIEGILNRGFIEITKDEALPGDLVISRMGKKTNVPYSHGGIIEAWPTVWHVCTKRGVTKIPNALSSAYFGVMPDTLRFFSLGKWRNASR